MFIKNVLKPLVLATAFVFGVGSATVFAQVAAPSKNPPINLGSPETTNKEIHEVQGWTHRGLGVVVGGSEDQPFVPVDDATLAANVKATLAGVDKIRVVAEEGRVHIYGLVDNDQQSAFAYRAAAKAAGVKSVMSHIMTRYSTN